MGFEWQFGTGPRAGRTRADEKIGVENIDGAACTCKSVHGKLRESVRTGIEHTDGSACGNTSAKRD
jgi:hypothetical protein